MPFRAPPVAIAAASLRWRLLVDKEEEPRPDDERDEDATAEREEWWSNVPCTD